MSIRAVRSIPVLLGLLSSCASVHFEPESETSGHFRSSAMSLTVLGHDLPQSALMIARANASDSRLPNLIVQREFVFPYLWRLDFLLDILSVRFAVITGTWGPTDG